MASGITLDFTSGEDLSNVDQSWKLTVTATNAKDTGGVGENDNNIFVLQKGLPSGDDFIHIATPTDMELLPNDVEKIAPKAIPFYRADTFHKYYKHVDLLKEAITDIELDVAYLIKSLDTKEVVQGTISVDFGTPESA